MVPRQLPRGQFPWDNFLLDSSPLDNFPLGQFQFSDRVSCWRDNCHGWELYKGKLSWGLSRWGLSWEVVWSRWTIPDSCSTSALLFPHLDTHLVMLFLSIQYHNHVSFVLELSLLPETKNLQFQLHCVKS